MPKHKYEVIVGNIGRVHVGSNKADARSVYFEYVRDSAAQHGRAAGEDVTLFMDGEILMEAQGSNRKDEENG